MSNFVPDLDEIVNQISNLSLNQKMTVDDLVEGQDVFEKVKCQHCNCLPSKEPVECKNCESIFCEDCSQDFLENAENK